MKEVILEVNNLSIGFGRPDQENWAVKNLSYQLKKGEILGLVGESGSGKSISSLASLGLLPSAVSSIQGEIVLDTDRGKRNLLELDKKDFRSIRGSQIAMIFQEPMTSLNPVLTCGEQVMESVRLHLNLKGDEAKEEVIRWFKEVELPRPEQIFEAYPHQISGGQKQRVMIAMAMCSNPRILFADEPTTALDVTVQKKILFLIKQLQKKHEMSVVFISHDLGVIAEIADRVMVMQAGEKVEEAEVEELFLKPREAYTKGLLACRPPLDYRLERLPTVKDFLGESGQHFTDLINAVKISPERRAKELESLFSGERQLLVKDLKTYFPIRKGIFQKAVDYVRAVDGVSFDVYKGETLGLVGESGCGKTTLGRTVLQLIKPSSGEVSFEGNNLIYLGEREMREMRKQMQIIFQDPYSSLNPRIPVGQAILEPMQVHKVGSGNKERKDRVIELMETVGLKADQFYRFPHEFSGGQRQRVCIARALALEPKFIICDESVSALDVSVQAQVLNLLNELKSKFQFTYIFISHDLSVVKYMSDRMIVMQAGKIVESGIADDIYNNPKEKYTQQLIESIPKIEFAHA